MLAQQIVFMIVSDKCSDEALEKLNTIDNAYDCIFIHFPTNDIRKYSPEYCVELFDQFIEKVTSHCTFAKIVLSLPFLTVRDVELNEKILKCVVLLQYKYIDNTIVTVCENTGLSARRNAVNRFFVSDGIHLSRQGTNLFVANVKHRIRVCLNVKVVNKQQSRKQSTYQNKGQSVKNKQNNWHSKNQRGNSNSWLGTGNRFNRPPYSRNYQGRYEGLMYDDFYESRW